MKIKKGLVISTGTEEESLFEALKNTLDLIEREEEFLCFKEWMKSGLLGIVDYMEFVSFTDKKELFNKCSDETETKTDTGVE